MRSARVNELPRSTLRSELERLADPRIAVSEDERKKLSADEYAWVLRERIFRGSMLSDWSDPDGAVQVASE